MRMEGVIKNHEDSYGRVNHKHWARMAYHEELEGSSWNQSLASLYGRADHEL